jgi:hypothetical protein
MIRDIQYKSATQGTMIGVTVAGNKKIASASPRKESWQSGIALAC